MKSWDDKVEQCTLRGKAQGCARKIGMLYMKEFFLHWLSFSTPSTATLHVSVWSSPISAPSPPLLRPVQFVAPNHIMFTSDQGTLYFSAHGFLFFFWDQSPPLDDLPPLTPATIVPIKKWYNGVIYACKEARVASGNRVDDFQLSAPRNAQHDSQSRRSAFTTFFFSHIYYGTYLCFHSPLLKKDNACLPPPNFSGEISACSPPSTTSGSSHLRPIVLYNKYGSVKPFGSA
ncbi:hypothetical protein CPB84DRAFT_1845884 [Gymnopilus junonius]|uniref:Uncharacterized protein n=1 Tax=Gymnopilus junonius TaxID=109634 RepID=A0A9P5TPK0_GYMJU|nr:hypothetical protein CPB84DRAFT_1845884 [Gymnopilus junonius]